MTATNSTQPEAKKVIGQDLKGKRVCIKGEFTDAPRYEYEGWLQDIGATLIESIDAKPDILIAGVGVRELEAQAQELGIQVLNEDEAMESLKSVNETISPEWAARIIDRLIASVSDEKEDCYYQLSRKNRYDKDNETVLFNADNLKELTEWLTEELGEGSDFQRCEGLEEVLSVNLTSIRLNHTNNVTIWYYDEECEEMEEFTEARFNTHEEAIKHFKWLNGHGHLCVIKVIEKKGDEITVMVGDELLNTGYSFVWDIYEDKLSNCPSIPSWISDGFSDNKSIASKQLQSLIRQGQWLMPRRYPLGTEGYAAPFPKEQDIEYVSAGPLAGKDRELCQLQVEVNIAGETCDEWTAQCHKAAVYASILEGGITETVEEILSASNAHLHHREMGLKYRITNDQYITAAKDVIANAAASIIANNDMGEIFREANSCLAAVGASTGEKYVGNFVERSPQNKRVVWEFIAFKGGLVRDSFTISELKINNRMEIFKEQIIEDAHALHKMWCEKDGKEPNYWDYGGAVAQLFIEAGVIEGELLTRQELAERLAKLKAPAEVPLVGSELIKRVKELKAENTSMQEILSICGYYKDGEDYGKANIKFYEEKLKAERQLKKKMYTEPLPKLDGKKVCITGKFNLKRSIIEDQLKCKGVKVVGSVSKNTDLLIVGADAGSKLTKAQELGIQVLKESEALQQGYINEELSDNQKLELLIEKLAAKAEQQLKDKEWNERNIEWIAELRYAFTHYINGSPTDSSNIGLSNFLGADWGKLKWTDEEIAQDLPFNPDRWTPEQVDAFAHDYTDNTDDEYFEWYRPKGWIVRSEDYPMIGAELLAVVKEYDFYDWMEVECLDDFLEAGDCELEDDQEDIAELLVRTCYWTNQQALQKQYTYEELMKAKEELTVEIRKAMDDEIAKALG